MARRPNPQRCVYSYDSTAFYRDGRRKFESRAPVSASRQLPSIWIIASALESKNPAFRVSIHASKSRTSHRTSPLANRIDWTGHSISKRLIERPQCPAASDFVSIRFCSTFRLRVALGRELLRSEMKAHVLGLALLRERGVQLLSAVDGQSLTEDTDEMTEGMVTIMAVFAQIEKKRLVKKLRAARDRQSLQEGRRVEGRKGYRDVNPELVRTTKRLAHGNRKERLSLRGISSRLAEMGYVTSHSTPFSAAQISRLLKG